VIAESPKIGPHRDSIRQALAATMDCHVERISVKATTTEKLGFCGRREGIAVEAVVLLHRVAPHSAAPTDSWPA
jgi:2-C-methyl-D-erythritol 2,4-cyclodiphosphate synthase